MRLSSTAVILASLYSCVFAFAPAPSAVGTMTSTSLEARRSLLSFPTLRRPSLLFPDFDRMFDEVDEMMEKSLAIRPGLTLKQPLGFEVTQDDHEYKVAMNVPDAEMKDLDLQLDHDGRVLRLKGDRFHEEGGMKVQSRFEKAILLSPDIDTSKLHANLADGTLTVIAPKFDPKKVLEKKADSKMDTKKIDIHFEEPKAALESTTEKTAKTTLPIETLKTENVPKESKHETAQEQKWPARDFPY